MLERPAFPRQHLIRWLEFVGACTGIVLLFFPHTPFAFRFVVVGVALGGCAVILVHYQGRVREWERFDRFLRRQEREEARTEAATSGRRSGRRRWQSAA